MEWKHEMNLLVRLSENACLETGWGHQVWQRLYFYTTDNELHSELLTLNDLTWILIWRNLSYRFFERAIFKSLHFLCLALVN